VVGEERPAATPGPILEPPVARWFHLAVACAAVAVVLAVVAAALPAWTLPAVLLLRLLALACWPGREV
jgi:hypothetical protein